MTPPSPWTRLRKRMDGYEQKSEIQPDEHGWRAGMNIAHLQTLEAAIRDEIDREIIRAREQGATWHSIPFGTSKQAAQQRHASAVRRRTPINRH